MKLKIAGVGVIAAMAAVVVAVAVGATSGGGLPANQTAGGIVIAGIEGGDPGSTQIDVQSWSWGVANTASLGSAGGGAGAGKATFHELTIVKTIDKASPALALASATGRHIPTVTLNVFRSSGDRTKPYLEITLSEVLVTSVQHGGSNDDQPLETVSFAFGKIELKYTALSGEVVDSQFAIQDGT